MPPVYTVSNVEEAVELAYKFKEEGTYNWFRGQVADHAPHSSLHRCNTEEKLEAARSRYDLFRSWVHDTTELVYLLDPENVDQLEAIMQHYGIPTHYLDFTTEPAIAGFFAADTTTPPDNQNSCIYCLNIGDLLYSWEGVKILDSRKECILKKVIIDVHNLWRLQAQRGVFLMSNYNFTVDYYLDKIVFPYTGYPAYPTKEIVYPPDKSALELLLDQYVNREKIVLARKQYEHAVHEIIMDSFPDGIYAEGLKEPSKLTIQDSWKKDLSEWNIYKIEKYDDTVGMYKKLRLNRALDDEGIRKTVAYGVKQLLRSSPTIRNRTINWNFEELPDHLERDALANVLSTVWNGMRSLPFDNEDISEACGNTVFLFIKTLGNPFKLEESQMFSFLFGKNMPVGFTNESHSGSYGYASFESILNATAIDINQLVKDEFKNPPVDAYNTFQFINNPRVLFDFTKFKTMFAKEIIPAQIAFDQPAIIFNPAKLTIFGIP